MVDRATLNTLQDLEHEMAQAGRVSEGTALREALRALARPERSFLTASQASERLGVSIKTVKRWIERGALSGGVLGGNWAITQESVEQLVRLRQALRALDHEGNPSVDEVRELYQRSRTAG